MLRMRNKFHMSRERLKEEYCFLKISLRVEKEGDPPETKTQLKALIVQALQTLHGQVGGSVTVDILSHTTIEERDGGSLTSAILRAPHRELVKVWSALTLCTGQRAVCSVDKASSSLLSLAVDSRQFRFPQ